MTSFGKTILHYMVALQPELDKRGFDLAVFHATGMGGRAFEGLAAQGAFACVMDFATQELVNHIMGSGVSAGPDRLTGAGRAGVPQIVAPACYDLVDLIGWEELPARFADRPAHAHNRLITSIVLNTEERREVARAHAAQLAQATGPTVMLLPTGGMNEWDRPGAPLHDAEGLSAFVDEMQAVCPGNVEMQVLDAHINDRAFVDAALAVLDRWLADGTVARG